MVSLSGTCHSFGVTVWFISQFLVSLSGTCLSYGVTVWHMYLLWCRCLIHIMVFIVISLSLSLSDICHSSQYHCLAHVTVILSLSDTCHNHGATVQYTSQFLVSLSVVKFFPLSIACKFSVSPSVVCHSLLCHCILIIRCFFHPPLHITIFSATFFYMSQFSVSLLIACHSFCVAVQ